MHTTSIIIISYNSAQIIQSCLGQLIESNLWPVIIVDNASPDGSAKQLCEKYPYAEVVSLEQNVGYGNAANTALKQIQTDYAFLLNPDLKATPRSIELMINSAEQHHDQAILFAPAVKKSDHTQNGMINRQWVSGSAMLFNVEAIKRLGSFDTNIFLFFEESDLCLHIIKSGQKILLESNIYIPHLKGKACTSTAHIEYLKAWHFGWSAAYFHTKHQLTDRSKKPEWMALKYRWKQCLATNKLKRLKYKARADGTRAFLSGQQAFNKDGSPFAYNPF